MAIQKLSSKKRLVLAAGLLLAAVAAAILLAPKFFPRQVPAISGPVLTFLSTSQASLVWEAAAAGNGAVDFREKNEPHAALRQIASEVTKVPYGAHDEPDGVNDRVAHIHKATIKGLKPGTVYSYRVSAAHATSPFYDFKTPELQPQKIVFAVYGDTRGSEKIHSAILELMKRYPIEFIVHTGDVAGFGHSYDPWQTEFFDCLKGLAERIPVFATKGNHDKGGFYELVCLPLGGKSDYSFDWGNAHFTCLDNNDGDRADGLPFAEKDLEASKAQWKFVFYHVPTIGLGGHMSRWQYPQILKTWDRLGVDLVLMGHSHLLERLRPVLLSPGATRATTYLTTGGGGANLYKAAVSPVLANTISKHNFCIVTLDGDSIEVAAISLHGNRLDHFNFKKTASGMSDAYLKTGITLSDLQAQVPPPSTVAITEPETAETDDQD